MNYEGLSPTVATREVGELVFTREVPAQATVSECLHMAWKQAQSEATLAYEDWRAQSGSDAYLVYRAAQDRADRAQDALAEWAAREARAARRRVRKEARGTPVANR